MNDDTPAPYGEITRRWTQLSEADRDHEARRLLGVTRLQAKIEQPNATSTHYRHLVEAAVAADEVAFAWLATSHRPLLIARGRALLRDEPAEWGAAALEVLHTTLHRVDPAEGRWLRSTVAQRLSARMNVHIRRHIDRQDREELTDPTRLHIHLPPDADDRDVHTELSAALADMLGRLDVPTRGRAARSSRPRVAGDGRRRARAESRGTAPARHPGTTPSPTPAGTVHADGCLMAPDPPTTVHLAVLTELHPASHRPDRVHGVLAWSEDGARHYHPILLAGDPRCLPVGEPRQLSLDLGVLSGPSASSAGLTWRTWSLASIPSDLRHLPPDGAARALANQLAAVTA